MAEINELIMGLALSAEEVASDEVFVKVVAKDVDGLGVHFSVLALLVEKYAA